MLNFKKQFAVKFIYMKNSEENIYSYFQEMSKDLLPNYNGWHSFDII